MSLARRGLTLSKSWGNCRRGGGCRNDRSENSERFHDTIPLAKSVGWPRIWRAPRAEGADSQPCGQSRSAKDSGRFRLRFKIAAMERRRRGPKLHSLMQNGRRRYCRRIPKNHWNDAAHCCDTIQRQAFARLVWRLLTLRHRLHAISIHSRHGHRCGHRNRDGRIGSCLANQANHGSQQEKKLQNAFHSRYFLRLGASKINEMVIRHAGQISSGHQIRRR